MKHLTRYKKEEIAFLQRIIAIDEIWMRDFKPELKYQSEVLNRKNSPKPQQFRCLAKQMMIMVYDYTGVIATICSDIWPYSEPACVRTLPSQNFDVLSSTNVFTNVRRLEELRHKSGKKISSQLRKTKIFRNVNFKMP